MFYDYRQNNSGGWFDIRPEDGISVHIIIEADSHWEANEKAENLGLYFNGESDCRCCGYRWCEASVYDGDDVPSIYGAAVHGGGARISRWARPLPEGFIHYKDGRMEAVWTDDERTGLYYGVRVGPWPTPAELPEAA